MAVAPRAVAVVDRRERREAVELPIAAHVCDAPPRAPRLEDEAEGGELDVLRPREPSAPVVDAHEHLHSSDPGVAEVLCDDAGRERVEPSVGVHDGDHDPVLCPGRVAGLARDERPCVAIRRVQRGGLALPRGREPAREHMQSRIVDAREDLARAIVGAVVDHEEDRVRRARGPQPRDGVRDRHLLVEGGDQEHPQDLGLGGARLGSLPPHALPEPVAEDEQHDDRRDRGQDDDEHRPEEPLHPGREPQEELVDDGHPAQPSGQPPSKPICSSSRPPARSTALRANLGP